MRLLATFTSDTDKALWRLALPMIFSNITVPLLGLVDTAVIGHLDSPNYLGGVAIGSMATSFLFMLLLFLRMSTTGLAAQALGAQNPLALARAFMQPLMLALLAGLAIVLLRHPLIDLALSIVGGDAEVLAQARLFLEIRWLSAPAALANLVLLGWLLGVQYVRAPVILLIVGQPAEYCTGYLVGDGAGLERAGRSHRHRHCRICHAATGVVAQLAGDAPAWYYTGNAAPRLAWQSASPAGAQPRHHAAIAIAAAVLCLVDHLWRTSRQRGGGGKCGTDEPADLYRLCAGRFCLCR
ncbi:DNA-damage-inducible SOS response protein [Serratia odorifera]|uniref:DNA-damage-inducible SOS response protein n=1 Tax=Serratia odorifera TaxID=618 RepID=A0A3S4FMI3_SEROD|nr:MATE family efflux transporter [Serratia odorifera]VDZ56564.1 DNA-damage-inducible SOS response protein [Serratia odorifera]